MCDHHRIVLLPFFCAVICLFLSVFVSLSQIFFALVVFVALSVFFIFCFSVFVPTPGGRSVMQWCGGVGTNPILCRLYIFAVAGCDVMGLISLPLVLNQQSCRGLVYVLFLSLSDFFSKFVVHLFSFALPAASQC